MKRRTRVFAHHHGKVDDELAGSRLGLWALKWSFIGLFATAVFQTIIVIISDSVGLLADTIHNYGDALTAGPLAIAFVLSRRKPTKHFPYGLHRSEDLAGLFIIILILISGAVAAYESVERLINPTRPGALGAVALAGTVGFLGNEAAALFRIRIGRRIGSAALIADGLHSRIDGLTSLAVVAGAIGVALGFPIADPIVGLIITVIIFRIAWSSVKQVSVRILDGVDPGIIDEIRNSIISHPGVLEVSEIRARWLGHKIHAEVNIAVPNDITVESGHEIALQVGNQLKKDIDFLGESIIHVDPMRQSGEQFHTN